MKLFKKRLLAASITAVACSSAIAQSNYDYQVITTPESVLSTFGGDINDLGLVTFLARTPTGAELNFDYLNPSALTAAGIPVDFDPETDTLTRSQYLRLVTRLADRENVDITSLRIATEFAGEYDGQNVNLLALLNQAGNGASSQLNSADQQILGINQNNIRVGVATAPYQRAEHTYQPEPTEDNPEPEAVTVNYAEREFTSRGFWYDGTNYTLIEPEEQHILGGESALLDINENNMAAGFMSVALTPDGQERAEVCAEYETATDSELNPYTCYWQMWHLQQSAPVDNLSSFGGAIIKNGTLYDINATIWQLDDQGQVINYTKYAPLMERLEDDEDIFSTYAYAINNNDIAVGQSWTYWGEEPQISTRIKMPAVFVDGETIAVTTSEDYIWGSAVDINDDNQVIGFVLKSFTGYRRSVPFVYDVDTETFEELPTFFVGSSTFPNAINNQGWVVGSAEIDSSLNTIRRRVGYVYNMNDPEQGLINLNDAAGCPTDYFIVSGDGINEQNQIVATAISQNEVVDENGNTQNEQVTVTLQLNPTTGEIGEQNCSNEEQQIERQGAATSPFSLFAMLLIGGLITLRRKISL